MSVTVTFLSAVICISSAKTYTVTFDADGGSATSQTKEVIYNKEYGELPTPTKTGYDFVGWFLKEEGNTEGTQIICS